MLKKVIAGLQALDVAVSAPGFKAGAVAGAAVTAATVMLIWAVL